MIRVILRRGDGLSERSWLMTVVRHVQMGLAHAGQQITPDGLFGSDTESAVKAFQRTMGIGDTGIVDKPTWDALSDHLDASLGTREKLIEELLTEFHGDPDWVHEQEGHRGEPYWPEGQSGVTLDPGIDLGHANRNLIKQLYRPLMTREQYEAVEKVMGLKGQEANQALQSDQVLKGIRITSEQANEIMPYAARPYWEEIAGRFPSLKRAASPPAVQTVFLSLAYNRGAHNRDLDQLGEPLEMGDSNRVADRIGAMQQDHKLEGIRLRRRREAELIRAELEYLQS